MLSSLIRDDQLLLRVAVGWGQNVQELVVLVDTGFTGDLKVTPQIAEDVGIKITDVRVVTMGHGKPIDCGSGLAYVSIEGVEKELSALIIEGTPVIGVRLLRAFGYTLTADFPSNEFTLRKSDEISFEEES